MNINQIKLAAEVPDNTTVEELKMLKDIWIGRARENGYPGMIWTIVRWLGEVRDGKHGKKNGLIFEFDNIKVYGNETPKKYDVKAEAYVNSRKIHVWVDEDYYVMAWEWEVISESEKHEVIETSLFVPGHWLEKLLAHIGPAQTAEIAYNASLTEDERQRLMKQLLIGMPL